MRRFIMTMKSSNLFFLPLVLASTACGGGAAAQWDAQAASSLRAEPEAMLKNLDAANFDGMLAHMDDDSIVLDIDDNNRPVRFQGRENVKGYFAALDQAVKS